MKQAICSTESDARALQAADDKAGNLPWPGVYLDGTPAPAGQGVTLHRYDVQAKPDGKAYAFPVSDTAQSEAKAGDPIKAATIVDALPADWAAVADPIKEEPAEAVKGR